MNIFLFDEQKMHSKKIVVVAFKGHDRSDQEEDCITFCFEMYSTLEKSFIIAWGILPRYLSVPGRAVNKWNWKCILISLPKLVLQLPHKGSKWSRKRLLWKYFKIAFTTMHRKGLNDQFFEIAKHCESFKIWCSVYVTSPHYRIRPTIYLHYRMPFRNCANIDEETKSTVLCVCVLGAIHIISGFYRSQQWTVAFQNTIYVGIDICCCFTNWIW